VLAQVKRRSRSRVLKVTEGRKQECAFRVAALETNKTLVFIEVEVPA
jgi:hypothetical protein